MFLQHRAPARWYIKFGFLFLAVANIANYVLHRNNAFPDAVSDPISGFLFGLCFGCFGLGMWMHRRQRSS